MRSGYSRTLQHVTYDRSGWCVSFMWLCGKTLSVIVVLSLSASALVLPSGRAPPISAMGLEGHHAEEGEWIPHRFQAVHRNPAPHVPSLAQQNSASRSDSEKQTPLADSSSENPSPQEAGGETRSEEAGSEAQANLTEPTTAAKQGQCGCPSGTKKGDSTAGFLSYRVASEADTAEKLVFRLEAHEEMPAGARIWWDGKNLEDGEPWKEGFCGGVLATQRFIPLISSKAIQPFQKIKEGGSDNFLTEIETALDMLESRPGFIIPVCVGEYERTPSGSYGLVKFKDFDVSMFPDVRSASCSKRTVRETMRKLFEIQCITLDPAVLGCGVDRVVKRIISPVVSSSSGGTEQEEEEQLELDSIAAGFLRRGASLVARLKNMVTGKEPKRFEAVTTNEIQTISQQIIDNIEELGSSEPTSVMAPSPTPTIEANATAMTEPTPTVEAIPTPTPLVSNATDLATPTATVEPPTPSPTPPAQNATREEIATPTGTVTSTPSPTPAVPQNATETPVPSPTPTEMASPTPTPNSPEAYAGMHMAAVNDADSAQTAGPPKRKRRSRFAAIRTRVQH